MCRRYDWDAALEMLVVTLAVLYGLLGAPQPRFNIQPKWHPDMRMTELRVTRAVFSPYSRSTP